MVYSLGIIDLLLTALAVYYITLLLTQERGPFDVFAKMREAAGMKAGRYDLDNDTGDYVFVNVDRSTYDGDIVWLKGDTFWSRVLSCHRCTAPYVTAVVLPVAFIFPQLLYIFAIPGIVVLLNEKG